MCILPPNAQAVRRPEPLLPIEPTPMCRRPHHPARPPATILQALAAFDISCACQSSLIVSCAVGGVSGCRQRRHEGACACRLRLLPTCILDADGTGCSLWRAGKTCRCKRLHMPRCLAVGCNDRQRGKRCNCPRTPAELCPHVVAKLTEYAQLTPIQAERIADAWAEKLWTLLREKYADCPAASAGCFVQTQEARVDLMSLRQALGLSLWHPADRCGVAGDEGSGRRMRRQGAGLRRLFGVGASEKGGVA